METVTIRQEVDIETSPEKVYEALLSSKDHSNFTESEAHISDKEGESFSAYDGYILGKNIKLIPTEKITQKWRAVESNWPEDHWSTVEFHLSDNEEGGTRLIFIQKELPKKIAENVANGWHKYYWKPLNAYFK